MVKSVEAVAHAQLTGGKPLGTILAKTELLFDRLPGDAAEQGPALAEPVLTVERHLLFQEIPVRATLAVGIKIAVGPVNQAGRDEKSLALLLQPGTGLRGARTQSRGYERCAREDQVSKPGLSRRTRSSTAAQAISLKNSFEEISSDCPKTRSCIF